MTCTATIVTGDADLADALLRLAAAAAVPADVAHNAAQARPAWHRCPLILVGADLAEAVATERLPHRPGVVLVIRADDQEDAYRRALRIGAQDLAVLPDEEEWLLDALTAAADPTGRATTICVRGARGGIGTSVLAAALALTAPRSTLLVDADPYGGGIDLLLGLEDTKGARWPDLASRKGRLNPSLLQEALPRRGDLAVLSWGDEPAPLSPETARATLAAAGRAFDLLIVDVPRHLTEPAHTALKSADLAFLLVPTEVRATVAAAALPASPPDLRLITTGPSPGGLTPDLVAQSLNLPLAGVLPRDRRIPPALEEGDLPRALRRSPLRALCQHLLATPHAQAA